MRILTRKTISKRDLDVCRILAVHFIRKIPILYGHKFVRYNVHLLLHIVDSVELWGAPWASSAFLYESWGGLLSNYFNGTKTITKEIFSYFLARNFFHKFSKFHIQRADNNVTQLYVKLDPAYSEGFINRNSFPIGKIESNNLDGDTKHVLTQCLGSQICYVVQECKRFQLKNKIFSIFEYSKRFRRDNSVVSLKCGKFDRIQSILNVRTQCNCTSECDRGNNWDEFGKVLFLAHELKCASSDHVNDKYLNFNLASFVKSVDTSYESPIVVINPHEIECKCVLVTLDNEMYCLKLDMVFEGN